MLFHTFFKPHFFVIRVNLAFSLEKSAEGINSGISSNARFDHSETILGPFKKLAFFGLDPPIKINM